MHYVRIGPTEECSHDVQVTTHICVHCSEQIYFSITNLKWYHWFRIESCYYRNMFLGTIAAPDHSYVLPEEDRIYPKPVKPATNESRSITFDE